MTILRLIIALLVFPITALGTETVHPTRHPAEAPMEGKRVMFDETFQFWTTREAADRTLRRIKEAGFTVYVPVVWYGAGSTWPSKLAPWDPAVAEQGRRGFDPLRYVIDRAHSMGIEVHAWFTVALRRSDIFPGLALAGVRERGELGIFDIHNPDFRALITALIVEVARNYDVESRLHTGHGPLYERGLFSGVQSQIRERPVDRRSRLSYGSQPRAGPHRLSRIDRY